VSASTAKRVSQRDLQGMGWALRYGAIAANPVREIERIEARPKREPRAWRWPSEATSWSNCKLTRRVGVGISPTCSAVCGTRPMSAGSCDGRGSAGMDHLAHVPQDGSDDPRRGCVVGSASPTSRGSTASARGRIKDYGPQLGQVRRKYGQRSRSGLVMWPDLLVCAPSGT
jgi:hypothetical protein